MTATTEQLLAAREKLMGIIEEATTSYQNEVREALRKMGVISKALLPDANSDMLTERIVELRDLKGVVKNVTGEVAASIEREVEQVDAKLLEVMDTAGATQIKASGGTAFIQIKSRYNCSDWESYYGYLKEHDRFDLLEKRPAQGALKKLQEDEGFLPPGISTYSERTVTVRRS